MDNMNPVGYGLNFPHFHPLNFRDYRNYLPTAYDNSLSMQESLLQVLNFCNELGLLNQNMSDNWNMLLGWIKINGIDDAVSGQLNAWVADGTMAKVLDKTVLNQINQKMDELLADYPQQLQDAKNALNSIFNTFKNYTDNKLNVQDNKIQVQDNKIQQNYVSLRQQLSSISNGVRGVYPNLSALTAAKPNGNTGTYVTTDNGHWFFWNGNAWTDGGVYQSAGIADGSIVYTLLANKAVIPAKTSFISPSNNLLIDANWNMGYFVPATLIGAHQTYQEDDRFASQIVKVAPGKYCIGYTNYLTTIFDENLVLIRSVGDDNTQDKNLVITIAEGESYVGISVLKERLQAPDKTWMVKGNTPPEEITPDKINANISFENVTDTDQLSENIDKKIIYPVWNESEYGFDSELIPISPNSYFSVNNGYAGMKGAAGLVPYKEYNADKVLILSHDFQDAGAVVPDFIKTSDKTAYIQLSVYKSIGGMIYDSESIKHIFLVMGRRDTLKDVSPDDGSLFGQSTLRNLYKYPDYPVWGYEYMHGYYAKVFQSQKINVVMAGDSTTEEKSAFWLDGHGRKVDILAKIFKIGNYPADKLTIYNEGYGSRATQEFVGTNKFYSHDSDKTDYPNGTLDVAMKLNPDLLIFGYGINDATLRTLNGTLPSIPARVQMFERNLYEFLKRVRGTAAVNGRPAYGRDTDSLSIILTVPNTTNNPNGAHREDWHEYIRPIIFRAAREYQCAVVDFCQRYYDRDSTSLMWSSFNVPPYYDKHDGLHPTPYTNADMMSLMQEIVYPMGLWKVDDVSYPIMFRGKNTTI